MSYLKCAWCPQIVIKCGYINNEQIKWWKKLYFYGLGELFYTNNIHNTIEDFVTIKCEKEKNELEYGELNEDSEGYIVPIGGGKDSVVTLETLNINKQEDYCLIINPKPVTLECAKIAGIDNNHIIEIYIQLLLLRK